MPESLHGMPPNLQDMADARGYLIQPRSLRAKMVLGTKAKSKTIPTVAGNHMQMHMKDFLSGGFPIGQKEIHPFTAHGGPPKRPGEIHGHAEQVSAGLRLQLVQACSVDPWHDQDMPLVHGLDVHKGHRNIISIDSARWGSSTNDLTERAD
jgi:hypothetical protein